MTKKLIAAVSLMALVAPTVALAGSPDTPGAFGRDRAAILKGPSFIGDDETPGASKWGSIAGDRAGDNGQMNRDYKTNHGGDPNPDNDSGSGND